MNEEDRYALINDRKRRREVNHLKINTRGKTVSYLSWKKDKLGE